MLFRSLDVAQHVRAGDVRGQQIRRELNPSEPEIECLSDARDQERLGKPGHPHEKRVAPGEQRDQQGVHDLLVKSDGKMGHTKHLSNEDLDALEAYLQTL